MTELSCSVTSCTHNSDCYCCKGEIQVGGSDATEKHCTCCDSFSERRGDSFRNSFESPSESLKVGCEAEHCVYNNDCCCCADHIDIAGAGAKAINQTECSTFKSAE